jgi:hypothetical protein
MRGDAVEQLQQLLKTPGLRRLDLIRGGEPQHARSLLEPASPISCASVHSHQHNHQHGHGMTRHAVDTSL